MKKKTREVTPERTDKAIAILEDVLVEAGAMLPTRPHQLTDEDFELYGQGIPKTYAQLSRDVREFQGRQDARIVDSQIEQSLAIAARNGDKITQEVRDKMREDRERAQCDEEGGED